MRATTSLVSILCIFFVVEVASEAIGSDSALLALGALPDSGQLQGQYWRFFTYSLLHGGYVHLLLNCSLLWWTGRIVERRVGAIPTVSIYGLSVLAAGIFISWWKSLHPTLGVSIGASAGVFGVLSASLVLLYRPSAAGFGQPSRIRGFLWLIAGIGVVTSFLPGISFVGHLGGLVSGTILGSIIPVLKENESVHNPNQPLVQ
jgi:rhomboid protease GluP